MRRLVAALSCFALLVGCNEAKPQRQREPNRASIGFIDAPAAQSTVGPMFTVTGWALDESSVKRVRVYLDDELVATVPIEVMRPDVDKAFPDRARAGEPHGFTAVVDAGARQGYCTIRVEALDGRGGLAQFANVTVKIEP